VKTADGAEKIDPWLLPAHQPEEPCKATEGNGSGGGPAAPNGHHLQEC